MSDLAYLIDVTNCSANGLHLEEGFPKTKPGKCRKVVNRGNT